MSCDLKSQRNERSGRKSATDMQELSATRKDPGNLTVRDFIEHSFRSYRGAQSHLKYHPTERALQVNTVLWKQVGQRKSFLDPIIKREAKKVDLGKYSTHSNWGDSLKNGIVQGHTRKGIWNPHERPLHTNEIIKAETCLLYTSPSPRDS